MPSVVQLQSLKGKISMVTGGCQNFGREIADGLAEAGSEAVIITSRTLDKATRAASELEKIHGVPFVPMALDLCSEESVEKLFADIKARFGRLDVLVNNAGGHSRTACGILEKESIAGWHDFIEANLTGTFLMLRAYARLMMSQGGGSVVNIASMAGVVGRDRRIYPEGMTPQPVAYAAAKAGIIGLTYDVAAYLGPYGIRVNAISPGGFERTQPAAFIRDYSDITMLRRMGRQGYDLKGAVVFLASDASGYVTGHNMLVDGGFTRYK